MTFMRQIHQSVELKRIISCDEYLSVHTCPRLSVTLHTVIYSSQSECTLCDFLFVSIMEGELFTDSVCAPH